MNFVERVRGTARPRAAEHKDDGDGDADAADDGHAECAEKAPSKAEEKFWFCQKCRLVMHEYLEMCPECQGAIKETSSLQVPLLGNAVGKAEPKRAARRGFVKGVRQRRKVRQMVLDSAARIVKSKVGGD